LKLDAGALIAVLCPGAAVLSTRIQSELSGIRVELPGICARFDDRTPGGNPRLEAALGPAFT
jgi:hypothetical protein